MDVIVKSLLSVQQSVSTATRETRHLEARDFAEQPSPEKSAPPTLNDFARGTQPKTTNSKIYQKY
eukprot:2381468-Amphidinium_carterae.2